MWPVDFIEEKRDGKEQSASRIKKFIEDYTQGRVVDYQAAAWLMAVYLKGMNERETAALTEAMRNSGDVVDLSAIEGVTVDKHSTGGIADTTTLIVAPLVAAAGVKVAKMSGRGLGFTGGTLINLNPCRDFALPCRKRSSSIKSIASAWPSSDSRENWHRPISFCMLCEMQRGQ